MEEWLPTWLLQNDSVHHSTLRARHYKEVLSPLIRTAYRGITRSAA